MVWMRQTTGTIQVLCGRGRMRRWNSHSITGNIQSSCCTCKDENMRSLPVLVLPLTGCQQQQQQQQRLPKHCFSRRFATNTSPKNYDTSNRKQYSPVAVSQFERRKQLIACKIYMNVGGDKSHVTALNDLIIQAQKDFAAKATSPPLPVPSPAAATADEENHHDDPDCRTVTTTATTTTTNTMDKGNEPDFTTVGALVHVHMDPYSNRSSLHIAGPMLDVISVAQDLVETAKNVFLPLKRGCKLPPDVKSKQAAHKVVDIIEHVSFLPLLPASESKITDNKNLYPPLWVPTYTAYAARQVGTFLRASLDMQVFFYEYAQRNNVSFEEIVFRRKKQFGLLNNIPESTLVGAFPDFVEDVHVLLAAQCGKQRVRDLVQLLNNHVDTGLSDVVATAQLYDVFRWEIHCRLLRPHLSGSNMAAIEHAVKRWNDLQKEQNDQFPIEFVVKCFRVGPTYDECVHTLQKVCRSEHDRHEYDQNVREKFQRDANYYATSSNTDDKEIEKERYLTRNKYGVF